jgi:hypothetical protein
MQRSTGSILRLAPPVACGGRLFVPLIRILSVSQERGGFGLCIPVALLIDEGGEWFFVSLDPDTTQECLGDLELLPAKGSRSDGGWYFIVP